MPGRPSALAAIFLAASACPQPLFAAPTARVIEATPAVRRIRILVPDSERSRALGGGPVTSGVLLAVPAGASPSVRLVEAFTRPLPGSSGLAVDRERLPESAVRPAERAEVGGYSVIRLEVAALVGSERGIEAVEGATIEVRFAGATSGAGAAGGRRRGAGRDQPARMPGRAAAGGDPVVAALRLAVVNPDDLVPSPRPAPPPGTAAAAPDGTCSACLRVEVDADGLYRLRHEDLAALHPAYDGAASGEIRIWLDGEEIPVEVEDPDGVFGPGDRIVFFGRRNPGLVTRTNVYWISPPAGVAGRRLERRAAFAPGDESLPQVAVVRGRLRFEEQAIHYGKMPDAAGKDPWMSVYLATNGPGSADAVVPAAGPGLDAPDLAAAVPGRDYRLRARVVGRVAAAAADDQEMLFQLNLSDAASASWSASSEIDKRIDARFDPALLEPSGNVLRVALLPPRTTGQWRLDYLDWVEVDYPRRLVVRGGELDFSDDWNAAVFYVGGSADLDLRVHVYDGQRAVRLVGPRVLQAGPGMPATLAFTHRREAGATGDFRFVAAEEGALRAPRSIELDEPSALRTLAGSDYVVVSHPRFLDEAGRLAAHRGGLALSLRDIYDEFSHGQEVPEALGDFVAAAVTGWPNPPRYLALVGDASYDPLNHSGYSDPDYDPPSLLHGLDVWLETAAGLRAPSDTRIVAVSGGDFLPDLTVGRIPARRAGDLDRYLAKIQSYEAQAAAPWMNRVELFADDDVNDDRSECGVPGQVAADMDGLVARYLPAADPANLLRRYAGAYSGGSAPLDLQRDVLSDLNGGIGVQVYLGHGNLLSIGRHCVDSRLAILDLNTLPAIANGARLPLAVTMTCEAGEFDAVSMPGTVVETQSIGERYLMAPDRGHVAWIATTAVLGYAPGADLTDDLFSVLYAGDPVGPPENRVAGSIWLGMALRNFARFGAGAADSVETLVLLGDPALPLRAGTP